MPAPAHRRNASPELSAHRAIYQYLRLALPGAAINHSPNGFHVPLPAALPVPWRAVILAAIKREVAKLKSMGAQPGWPDLIVICDGAVMAFEVKSDTGRATPEQTEALRVLAANGALIAVVRSVDDVRAALEKWNIKTRVTA